MSTNSLRPTDSAMTLSESHLDAMAMFLRIANQMALFARLRRELRQRYRGAAWKYINIEMERRGIRL